MRLKVTVHKERYELVIPDINTEGLSPQEIDEYISQRVRDDIAANVGFSWEVRE